MGPVIGLEKEGAVYTATASFGQGISVTPLQITNAFATLVNGGKLIKPYLVEKIVRGQAVVFEARKLLNLIGEEVKKIALLARIELTEEQVEKFRKDLSIVLDYVAELDEVDVVGVEEVSQVTGLVNVQREDIAVVSEHVEAIKNQAPEIKDGYYKVKAIL